MVACVASAWLVLTADWVHVQRLELRWRLVRASVLVSDYVGELKAILVFGYVQSEIKYRVIGYGSVDW